MNITKDLSIDQVTVGAVLATDLTDSNGALILPESTILSQAVLDKLKTRGEKNVCIVIEENSSNEQRDALRQQVEEQILSRFRKSDDQPLMQELKRIILSHQLKGVL